MNNVTTAFRASVLHCLHRPHHRDVEDTGLEFFADGVLLVRDGRVIGLGDAKSMLPELEENTRLVDHTGCLIVPGFIDTHVHYPQTDIIGSYGRQLLDWLDNYAFPCEGHFDDPGHAAEVAGFFLEELLRNGTTTALIFATVHPGSVDAIFAAARRRKMRVIAGKVLMDRHCPEYLRDTPQTGYDQSRELIRRWHGVDRLAYAVTPRFAPTSSEAQLERVGALATEHPDTYIHTHVAENPKEVAWVQELFPWSDSYLDVYDHYGMLRERSVYAHCIYLGDNDRARMADTGAAVSFCPTSNLFLGSGLLDLGKLRDVRVGMGTDVGGGTSFSMLRTLGEGYKVSQLAGHVLTPAGAFYLATLGGAESLYIDEYVGNFRPGREADFIVLDPAATPLLARRMQTVDGIEQTLFAYMILGDDRCVAATYVLGEKAQEKTKGSDSIETRHQQTTDETRVIQ